MLPMYKYMYRMKLEKKGVFLAQEKKQSKAKAKIEGEKKFACI